MLLDQNHKTNYDINHVITNVHGITDVYGIKEASALNQVLKIVKLVDEKMPIKKGKKFYVPNLQCCQLEYLQMARKTQHFG